MSVDVECLCIATYPPPLMLAIFVCSFIVLVANEHFGNSVVLWTPLLRRLETTDNWFDTKGQSPMAYRLHPTELHRTSYELSLVH